MSKEILYRAAKELGQSVEELVLEAIKGFDDQHKYGVTEEGYADMVRSHIEYNDIHGEPRRNVRIYIESKLEAHRKKAPN